MNHQGRGGVQGGRPHGGAALGQLDRGAGGSFFLGAGRLQTCGGTAATTSGSAQGDDAAGGRGRQR
jgi:hypothetical protein